MTCSILQRLSSICMNDQKFPPDRQNAISYFATTFVFSTGTTCVAVHYLTKKALAWVQKSDTLKLYKKSCAMYRLLWRGSESQSKLHSVR